MKTKITGIFLSLQQHQYDKILNFPLYVTLHFLSFLTIKKSAQQNEHIFPTPKISWCAVVHIDACLSKVETCL